LTPDDELVGLLVPPAAAEDEELLLQAAAARHKASDADATTAPFLAILIIKNHLASEGRPSGHIQACETDPPDLAVVVAIASR
jgi:hypothetical protein